MRRVIGVVLLGIGAFLIVLAPLVRFQVASKLIAAPADQYSVTEFEAPNAQYFSVGDGKVLTGTIDVTVTTRGDVAEAKDGHVVWDQFTAASDVTNNHPGISMSEFRSAFDKYTGAGVNCCGVAIDKKPVTLDGQIFLFPFGVEKKTYKVFNTSAGKAFDAKFVGEDTVNGLKVYKFQQDVPPTIVDTLTAPASLMGMDQPGDVQLNRWYDGTTIYWVEPESGAPVKQEVRRHEVLKTTDGVERRPALIADLNMTPDTVADLVKTAQDAKSQITLIKTTVPLVLLIAGIVLAAVGILLSARRTSAAHG